MAKPKTPRRMKLTCLGLDALKVIRQHPRISSQALVEKLGLKRECGIALHNQGAGRLGAAIGARLFKMGLVSRTLIDGGYRNGYSVTHEGEKVLRIINASMA